GRRVRCGPATPPRAERERARLNRELGVLASQHRCQARLRLRSRQVAVGWGRALLPLEPEPALWLGAIGEIELGLVHDPLTTEDLADLARGLARSHAVSLACGGPRTGEAADVEVSGDRSGGPLGWGRGRHRRHVTARCE